MIDLAVPSKIFSPLPMQRIICMINRIWLLPLVNVFIRGCIFLRCADLNAVRKRYAEIQAQGAKGPIFLCSNHLTTVDSLILGCFLNPTYRYFFDSRALPWNVPEFTNFGGNVLIRAFCYLAKSIFVHRLGSRESMQKTKASIEEVLTHGDIVSLFPEGGRSRSGRVEVENCVYGVGDFLQEFPGCRIICVYMRGRRQDNFSVFPKIGDIIDFSLEEIKPKTELLGRRGSKELTLQIMRQLKVMEDEVIYGRPLSSRE
jgi:1-acyl-sn-glycerol-3-phosphate acyltransferase